MGKSFSSGYGSCDRYAQKAPATVTPSLRFGAAPGATISALPRSVACALM